MLIGGPQLTGLRGLLRARQSGHAVRVTNELGRRLRVLGHPAPRSTRLIADFDGDGLSDIALLGDALSPVVPVAFSNGDGTFLVTAESGGDFPDWASTSGVGKLVGDYDHDGLADIALTGGRLEHAAGRVL